MPTTSTRQPYRWVLVAQLPEQCDLARFDANIAKLVPDTLSLCMSFQDALIAASPGLLMHRQGRSVVIGTDQTETFEPRYEPSGMYEAMVEIMCASAICARNTLAADWFRFHEGVLCQLPSYIGTRLRADEIPADRIAMILGHTQQANTANDVQRVDIALAA